MKKGTKIWLLVTIIILLIISITFKSIEYIYNDADTVEKEEIDIKENKLASEEEIKELKINNYKNIIYTDIENIAEESLVIFTSEKCSFCSEYMNKVKEKYDGDNIKIYTVDMGKEYNKSAWNELNIKGIPYTILVEDNIIKNTYLGLESFKYLP